MKVFINREPVSGPWGGGNRTITTLIKQLTLKGHEYTFNINEKFDVIYCHDPRPDNRGIRYEHFLYIRQNANIPIFQRVGDVFYHRAVENTEYLKETIKHSNKVSFITKWAANTLNCEIDNKRTYVHELRPPKIFHRQIKNNIVKKKDTVRIITHHWSSNFKKGVSFYNDIGELIQKSKYKNVEFVYLGRAHDAINKNNIKVIPPLDTDGVIDELDKSQIYVTASEFETGGNHVVEAIARGLPVMYHKNGGGINYLCRNNGHHFETIEDFELNLDKLIENIDIFKKAESLEVTSLEDVCNLYIEEMEQLIK